MNPLIGLLFVSLLIALNAVFVAGEFSLVVVDSKRIELLAENGNRRARITRNLLSRLSFHLGGSQLGITLTSLLMGVIAEDAIGSIWRFVTRANDSNGVVVAAIAVVIAALAQMIFGELAPKNLAISRPMGVALGLAPILRLYGLVGSPLILFFNNISNAIVRRLGIEPTETLGSSRSLDDLEYLVRASQEETLSETDALLITRTLRLSRKTAADALTARPAMVCLNENNTVGDLLDIARESGYSRFPVLGTTVDDIAGVAEVSDIFGLDTSDRRTTPLRMIMRVALAVPEQRELDGVLLDLERGACRLAIVVDEHGGTAGLITREDILEELVGDIEDEYDNPVILTRAQSGNRFRVEGTTSPDELAELAGFNLPDGPYETLAGFALQQFGNIPNEGDSFEWSGWLFSVVKRDRLRLAEISIRPAPLSKETDSIEEAKP